MKTDEPVSLAISKIINGEPCVIVLNGDEYHGIFTDLDVREVIDTSKEKIGPLCEKAPLLKENADVRDTVKLFLDGRYKALPIKTAAGYKVIRRNKFLKYLLKLSLLPQASVSEIMSTPPYTIEASESVGRAREIMRKNNIRRVIVTEDGLLAGIVAMQDILSPLESPKDRLPFVKDKESTATMPISSYMKREVNVLPPTASIVEATRVLENSTASSVVIAEERRPLGIVSVRDIFEIVAAQKESEPIYFSGMDRADEEHLPEVKSTIERTLAKVKNMARVEYLAVHYKKQRYKGLRSRYEVLVRMKGDKMVSVSSADWDIRTATQSAMKELLSVIKKYALKNRVLARERERNKRRE